MIIQRFGDGRAWFFKKRFGLFVHWGLYAIPAWHEQIQWRKGIARRDYEPLIRKFNPTCYDPEVWLDLAERTGMEYICLTTKHHDGLLPRKGQTLYVHLVKPPQTSAVLLKPFAVPPRSAVLLNTGRPVEFLVDQIPYLHPDIKSYLRLRNLPVNELAGEVPVVKLEFDAA